MFKNYSNQTNGSRNSVIHLIDNEVMDHNNDNPHYILGQRLKAMRETADLTQTELGKQLSLSGASISLIENGTSKLNIVRLKEYVSALQGHATIVIGPKEDRRAQLVELLASAIDDFDDMQLGTIEATIRLWITMKEEREKQA